jgi:heterodisulfide reductase subunit A
MAVKNALKIKEVSPNTEVFIFYRDVRTYGFHEALYTKARELGVKFIRFEEDRKPTVECSKGVPRNVPSKVLPSVGPCPISRSSTPGASLPLSTAVPQDAECAARFPPFAKGGNVEIERRLSLSVSVFDAMLGANLKLEPDLIVLSTATVPRADAEELATLLKVPLNQNKFFLEAHMKLRPVDFQSEGIFLCGLAHSPKTIDETIAQAMAAATRAATLLSQDSIEVAGAVAEVDEAVCAGCGVCAEMCSYHAIELIPLKDVPARTYGVASGVIIDGRLEAGVTVRRVARVGETCKGCGSCAAYCPSAAISAKHFKDAQLLSQVDALCAFAEPRP